MEPALNKTDVDDTSSQKDPKPLKRIKAIDTKLLQNMQVKRTQPKYTDMLQKRAQLPSFAFKEHIVEVSREFELKYTLLVGKRLYFTQILPIKCVLVCSSKAVRENQVVIISGETGWSVWRCGHWHVLDSITDYKSLTYLLSFAFHSYQTAGKQLKVISQIMWHHHLCK